VDRGRMLASGTLEELRTQVKHHGPLEDLFLRLTGDNRPALTGNGRLDLASESQPAGSQT
jgi:ABC-2 type transport system ATP-binding protein